MTNIEDIKQTLKQLEDAKEEAEMILRSILLPVLVTSKSTRKIVYANKYAERQYETKLEDIIGSHIDSLYSMEGQQEHIIEALKTKGYVDNFEEMFVTRSGKQFVALLSVIPIKYHGEDCYIGMVTDITKQKDVEKELRDVNKHIQDSINYASLIQEALMPDEFLFNSYFKDHFVIWEPKDIVGGDIYLATQLNDNEIIIMVIDCTGHGVPGAFVTMLVKAVERQIASILLSNSFIQASPSWILTYFNQTIKTLLKQDQEDSSSNAGFDGGVLYYNKSENLVKFSGAKTDLFYFDDKDEGKVRIIKGSRQSIGYKKSDTDFMFEEHEFYLENNMKFYITTDGFLDQNGGEKGFPLGKKRFVKILEKIYHNPMKEQKEILQSELKKYQNSYKRNDDITFIGLDIEIS